MWGGLWAGAPRPGCPAPAAAWELGPPRGWGAREWRALSTTHAVNPRTMWAYLRIMRSSQPQRRFLPVVTPTPVAAALQQVPDLPAGRQRVRGCGTEPELAARPAMAPRRPPSSRPLPVPGSQASPPQLSLAGRPVPASWAGEGGSVDPAAALRQAACLFCASSSGIRSSAQHISSCLGPHTPAQDRSLVSLQPR